MVSKRSLWQFDAHPAGQIEEELPSDTARAPAARRLPFDRLRAQIVVVDADVHVHAADEQAPGHGLHVAGENVLPPDVVETLLPVFREGSAEQRFARFEEQIAPRWAHRRPKGGVSPFWMRDWATALAARAALSSTGRSLRQLQRRVKHQTGRTQRELALLVRNEELFARVMSDEPGTAPDHAGLAVDAGFADQAHMIREVRRMTGMPPARILRLIATEESYWPYRLLGMRYG